MCCPSIFTLKYLGGHGEDGVEKTELAEIKEFSGEV